jgi:hypothetical protein
MEVEEFYQENEHPTNFNIDIEVLPEALERQHEDVAIPTIRKR